MRVIQQRVFGRLYNAKEKTILCLLDENSAEAERLYIRYALTLRGTEKHILPTNLLDDWGNEIRKLRLYGWLRKHGESFPRAEVFGYDLSGNETQHFVREFELFYKYFCYIVTDRHAQIEDGVMADVIAIVAPNSKQPEAITRPAQLKMPMRRAAVDWWQVPSASSEHFTQIAT